VELGQMHKEIINILKLSFSHIRASVISVIDRKDVVMKAADTQGLSRIWKIVRLEKIQEVQAVKEENLWILTPEELTE
jgi:hypothetical protein